MIHIFGHRNPDSDSVCSAIALAYLKNSEGLESVPFVLGDINNESNFILNHFDISPPKLLKEIKIQVSDLKFDKPKPVSPTTSILFAYNFMEENKIRTLPIVNAQNRLIGIVTMKDIAMHFIRDIDSQLDTSTDNILSSLNGHFMTPTGFDPSEIQDRRIKGNLNVISYYHETLKKLDVINEESIMIVGDNYEAIELAIENNVQLIIVTGGRDLPQEYIDKAWQLDIPIVSLPQNTYKVARQISLCNDISTIMFTGNVARFKLHHTLDDVKEDMMLFKYTNYPVLLPGKIYKGMLNRNHILTPTKKKVILVDHNEYGQSVSGLEEAEIIEIVDHHKIGDVNTSSPICFRNMPVGSTCTIVYNMYREKDIEIPPNIAGLLLSGIISDTMFFKSPTTTDLDRIAVEKLNIILNLDLDEYAHSMFKAGSSIEGQSIENIFSSDYKEFEFDNIKVGVSQIFSLDIDSIMAIKEPLLEYMDSLYKANGIEALLFVITDVLEEGSYVLFKGSNQLLIKKILDQNTIQGSFIKGIISRKKQLLPKISQGIHEIKNM